MRVVTKKAASFLAGRDAAFRVRPKALVVGRPAKDGGEYANRRSCRQSDSGKFRRNVAGSALAVAEDIRRTVSNAATVVGYWSLKPPVCRLGNTGKPTAMGHRFEVSIDSS